MVFHLATVDSTFAWAVSAMEVLIAISVVVVVIENVRRFCFLAKLGGLNLRGSLLVLFDASGETVAEVRLAHLSDAGPLKFSLEDQGWHRIEHRLGLDPRDAQRPIPKLDIVKVRLAFGQDRKSVV